MDKKKLTELITQYKWYLLGGVAMLLLTIIIGYFFVNKSAEEREFRKASTCKQVYQYSYDACIRERNPKETCYEKASEKRDMCNIFKERQCIKRCSDRWGSGPSFTNCKQNCQARY